jgi:excisionase family DNA binding protein
LLFFNQTTLYSRQTGEKDRDQEKEKQMNLKSVSETAPLIGCAEITLRRFIKNRAVPYRKIGSRYFFSDEDIQEYLDSVKVKPLADKGAKNG